MTEISYEIKESEFEGKKEYGIWLVADSKCDCCGQKKEPVKLWIGSLKEPHKLDKRFGKEDFIFEPTHDLSAFHSKGYGIDRAIENVKKHLDEFINKAKDC